ncbi:MAG: hypothetical protein MUQ32_01220 [Chloroflexi bacterium]|nr:hypothetical protein [Chloroflexota bacterium]
MILVRTRAWVPSRDLGSDREEPTPAVIYTGDETRPSILIIVWHLLSDPEADFVDLGSGFYDTRGGPQRAIRNHVHHLEALGYQVTLHPAA